MKKKEIFMRCFKIHSIFFFLLISLFNHAIVGFAESTQATFTISPLDEETGQVRSSYYDLMVQPKEKKKLTIRVFNNSDKETQIIMSANNGATNDNGITSYLGTEERDSSLKIAFTDLVSEKEQEVTLPANSHKDISVQVQLPEESFEGEILGGLRVTSKNDNFSQNDTQNQEAAVTNNIAYTIGVVLRESDKSILPNMNLLGVGVEQRNSRNYISSNLQNEAPRIIKELKAEQKVYKKGTDTVLYEASNSNMRMAPNSNFNFGINLENQPLQAGEYTLKISGTADEVPFSFEQDFIIDKEEAKELNRNSVYVQDKQEISIWIYGAIVLLLIALLVCGYFIRKERKSRR